MMFSPPPGGGTLFTLLATSVASASRHHPSHHHQHAAAAFTTKTTTATATARSRCRSSLLCSSSQSHGHGLPKDYPNLNLITDSLSAIRKAAKITTYLQPTTSTSAISGITKTDTSPVTIGDFAAQAIILHLLADIDKDKESQSELGDGDSNGDSNGHSNVFVAEESSKNLNQELSMEILKVFEQVGLQGFIANEEELKKSIDLGQTYHASSGELLDSVQKKVQMQSDSASASANFNASSSSSSKLRVWCLDPIDGTRGFLRGKRDGGQYCIALALIEDGEPIMGILACPNLPADKNDENYAWGEDEGEDEHEHGLDGEMGKKRGCIFVASRGGGCFQLPLYAPSGDDSDTMGAERVNVTKNNNNNNNGEGQFPLEEARFCVGVEKYGDPEGKVTAIAKKIHGRLDDDGEILFTRRMDSQVKYGVVARGGSEFITRLPKKEYHEWIWDHAAGRIVIEEAGGMQTDTEGALIDYGLGAKMDKDVDGILISAGGIFHEALLDAYREQEEERSSSS